MPKYFKTYLQLGKEKRPHLQIVKFDDFVKETSVDIIRCVESMHKKAQTSLNFQISYLFHTFFLGDLN